MIGSPLRTDVLFHLGPVPISSAVAVSWGIVAALALGSWLATRRLSLRPSRTQAVLELLVETIDGQIRDTMQVDPAPYRALIGSIFLFVLTANWSGLMPGIEPPTAHLETDAALAGIVFLATIVFGLRARGVRGYLATFAEPGWLMVPLNLVEQITRTFSLMVRLFGNVMSGVFVVGIALSLAGLVVPIPFMALDLLTGAIQAYIFSVLAMVFIGAAVHSAPPSHAPDAPASSDRRAPS
ncbi:F0F1 ATP synthase subunit A [Dyella sp. KRB-257]|uniref:F0F1 ATP synthase subunit A n=1 Tax=Dyella sp. KRB-257 TaxID=3400915 RepID=UPI003C0C36C7